VGAYTTICVKLVKSGPAWLLAEILQISIGQIWNVLKSEFPFGYRGGKFLLKYL